MKNSLIRNNGVSELFGLLRNPGDKLEAKITKKGSQVIKLKVGTIKYSREYYPTTGRLVETHSTIVDKEYRF